MTAHDKRCAINAGLLLSTVAMAILVISHCW